MMNFPSFSIFFKAHYNSLYPRLWDIVLWKYLLRSFPYTCNSLRNSGNLPNSLYENLLLLCIIKSLRLAYKHNYNWSQFIFLVRNTTKYKYWIQVSKNQLKKLRFCFSNIKGIYWSNDIFNNVLQSFLM